MIGAGGESSTWCASFSDVVGRVVMSIVGLFVAVVAVVVVWLWMGLGDWGLGNSDVLLVEFIEFCDRRSDFQAGYIEHWARLHR